MPNDIINQLLASDELSVRFKIFTNVMNESVNSAKIRKLQKQIKKSSRVSTLLSERGIDGKIPYHPYQKWRGAHWILACLSDLGYPAGDKTLIPMREQVYDWLFSENHEKHIKTIEGLVRRCASQESYALFYLLKLGLADNRTHELARRLIKWQWPDGGWNCDKRPEARKSSFVESLIPFRALSLHAKITGDKESKQAARRAVELFLKRELYKKLADGSVIKDSFIKLHYPCYYEYDILFALKVMAETGYIGKKRCRAALSLLESKRLPDGGFPAEAKLYKVAEKNLVSRCSLADWGGTSKKHYNEFVTADAIYVLQKAGRLKQAYFK